MMTELDDDDDWATSDELVDDDNDSSSVVAESALDRLACGLGGKTVRKAFLSPRTSPHQSSPYSFRYSLTF